MKLRSLFAAAALLSAIMSTPAQALVVNYTGSSINMGNVVVGQTGTISNGLGVILHTAGNTVAGSLAYGMLPANSIITFHYSLNTLVNGTLTSTIGYNYNKAGNHYVGLSIGNSNTGVNNYATVNGVDSTSLAFAFAALDQQPGVSTGYTDAANYTSLSQAFSMSFLGKFISAHPNSVITYSVSSIPLPAALPVVLLALAGLAFAAQRQRKALA